MPLTLKVLTFKGQPVDANMLVLEQQNASIGRADTNDLVLPDTNKFVSRHHASIRYKDGLYYLTDCSLSGVFLLEQNQVLHNDTLQIQDGMMFRIGEYELKATVEEEHSDHSFAFIREITQPTLVIANQVVQHEDLLDIADDAPSFVSELPPASALSEHFTPPEMMAKVSAIDELPDNFSIDDLFASPSIHATPPPLSPEPAKSVAVASDHLFAAFLRGAGISYTPSSSETLSELMFRVGQMFRHLIKGTIILLRTRSDFKALLRLDRTVMKHSDNNPLKLTVATNDVLRQFFDNNSEGYLGSIEAIDESFADLRHHQQAMQAGVETAITELLRTFDPNRIEKMSEQGVMLQRKAKCWDKYKETYHWVAEEVKMLDYFSEAFSKAYEQKLKELQHKYHQS